MTSPHTCSKFIFDPVLTSGSATTCRTVPRPVLSGITFNRQQWMLDPETNKMNSAWGQTPPTVMSVVHVSNTAQRYILLTIPKCSRQPRLLPGAPDTRSMRTPPLYLNVWKASQAEYGQIRTPGLLQPTPPAGVSSSLNGDSILPGAQAEPRGNLACLFHNY